VTYLGILGWDQSAFSPLNDEQGVNACDTAKGLSVRRTAAHGQALLPEE
jgi:hypothetical protein